MSAPRLILGAAKHRMRELGVAETIVNATTPADVDAANSPDRVTVTCHKCNEQHTVEREWAAGRKFIKCGGCYL